MANLAPQPVFIQIIDRVEFKQLTSDVPLPLLGASSCHGHINRRTPSAVLKLAPASLVLQGSRCSSGARHPRRQNFRSNATQAYEKGGEKKKNTHIHAHNYWQPLETKLCDASLPRPRGGGGVGRMSVTLKPRAGTTDRCCHRPAGVSRRAVTKQTPASSSFRRARLPFFRLVECFSTKCTTKTTTTTITTNKQQVR